MHGDDRPEGATGSNISPGPPARTLAAPILQFDLRAELELLRSGQRYRAGVPAGNTLVKEDDLRIVLMAMKAGTRMEEHSASGPISLQGIEGHVRLYLPQGGVDLVAGALLAIEANLPHDVEALEDSAFLLTIGRTTYREVSDHHEPRG